MKKRKLFLDFDNTICDSISSYVKFYNEYYSDLPNFKIADPKLVRQYDLKDQCPLIPNPSRVFDMKEFFYQLNLFPNCRDVLKELKEKWELIIVTIGTHDNLKLKIDYIENYLPFVDRFILQYNGENCFMNKDLINMNIKGNEENVFLDDHSGNLHSSNCLIKLNYGIEADWNKDWIGTRIRDWASFREVMIRI